MYRTDKQFMTNPATASSRIYIGSLPKTVVAADLEEKFKYHGNILGLVLQTGFAFIQYENEMQARAAINSESNTMLYGRKIIVKQALDKSQKNVNNQFKRQPPIQQQYHMDQQFQHQQGPPRPQGPPQHQQTAYQPGLAHHQQGPPYQQQGPPHHQQVPPQHQQAPPQQQQGPPQHQQGLPSHQQGPPQNQQGLPQNQQGLPQNQQSASQLQDAPPQHQGPPQNQQTPQHQQMSSQQHPPSNFQQNQQQPQQQAPPNFPQNNQQSPNYSNSDLQDPSDCISDGLQPPPPQIKSLNQKRIIKDEGPPEKRQRRRRGRQNRDNRFPGAGPLTDFNNGPSYDGVYKPSSISGYNGPSSLDQPERNDCEIIVVSRLLTKYAEYIEQTLKGVGLTVDLLFPNEDVPIGRVLANISSRGCLYAILVMPQNEEHRSLTLNILHGIPQEHRNMPLEDAIILITRNFDAYMHGDKITGESQDTSIADRHPSSIQMLLNLLAENRQITTAQYDKLLLYLQERRELQHQHEVAEGIEQNSEDSSNKQVELQSRIMNILNKAHTTENVPQNPAVTSDTQNSTQNQTTGTSAPPLLKDPSVQKALDSLIVGDMFKNITSVH